MQSTYKALGGHGESLHRPLATEQLRSFAPSIFADGAHCRTSSRYSFLPTSSILSGMADEGWLPVAAQEQLVRDRSRAGFQKHMLRFAHRDDLQRPGAERPEIVIVNSHDRSSAYQLHAGIFRVLRKERNGATVALDLAIPAQPVICWIVARNPEAVTAFESHTPDTRKPSREERLTGRRLALINERLVAAVKDAAIPTQLPMLKIVAAFGTSRSRCNPGITAIRNTWDALDSTDFVPGLDDFSEQRVTPEQAAWDSVREVITARLAFNRNQDLLEKNGRDNDMEQIAALVGFRYQQEWQAICTREIPVPKSWGPGFDPITLNHPARERTPAAA